MRRMPAARVYLMEKIATMDEEGGVYDGGSTRESFQIGGKHGDVDQIGELHLMVIPDDHHYVQYLAKTR